MAYIQWFNVNLKIPSMIVANETYVLPNDRIHLKRAYSAMGRLFFSGQCTHHKPTPTQLPPLSLMKKSLSSIFLALVAFALPASAVTISFDEFPADDDNGPMPAGRYSSLGVTFLATDDGSTWGGLDVADDSSDPGGWGLRGTNGPQFSGFNGESYGLIMTFAADVSGFSLDVSRSNNTLPGQSFTLQGYNNSVLVDSVTVTLGEINSWTSVPLAGVIDETRWIGDKSDPLGNPFGVDNVSWTVPDGGSYLAIFGLTLAGLAGIRRKFGV